MFSATNNTSLYSVGYYSSFLDSINPASWIRKTVEEYLDQRNQDEYIRQQALYNVVVCLVHSDKNNCNEYLKIAAPLFKSVVPPVLVKTGNTRNKP